MKKIDWLDNFAESYSTKLKKTASKKLQSIIVDKATIKNASVGDVINYNGKQYKVADLDYVDDKGKGAVLDEVGYGEGIPATDPMSIAMGAPVMNFTEGMKPQEYSRTDPGSIYDVPVEENYEDAAAETAKQIADENAVDRTTVENHYKDTRTVETPAEDTLTKGTSINDISDENVEDAETDIPVEDVIDSEDTDSAEDVNDEANEELEKTEELHDEDTDDSENTDEFGGPVTAMRYNRILKRILSSK